MAKYTTAGISPTMSERIKNAINDMNIDNGSLLRIGVNSGGMMMGDCFGTSFGSQRRASMRLMMLKTLRAKGSTPKMSRVRKVPKEKRLFGIILERQ